MTTSVKGLWASKDRRTLWTKTYTLTGPSVRHTVITIEKVQVADPSTQQLCKGSYTMRVVPLTRAITHGGKVYPLSVYYTLAVNYMGGDDKDALGGFASGAQIECYEPEYRRQVARLHRDGFVVAG